MDNATMFIRRGATLFGISVTGVQVIVESDAVVQGAGSIPELLAAAGIKTRNCSFNDCLFATTAMVAMAQTSHAIARASGGVFHNPFPPDGITRAVKMLYKPA